MIDRPVGHGDYLIMLFHHPTVIGFDGRTKHSAGGEIIIWPPGVRQKYGYTEEMSETWTHSWIHIDGNLLAKYIRESRLPIDKPFSPVAADMFDDYLYRLYREVTENVNPDDIIVSNFVQNMLREFGRVLYRSDNSHMVPEEMLRAKNMIEQFADQNLMLEQVAEVGGYSVPHFCVLFKEYFGVSPIAYATQVRMQQATYLLQDRNRQITAIAKELGYKDVYHFSKRFKEFFGYSPKQQRKSDIN